MKKSELRTIIREEIKILLEAVKPEDIDVDSVKPDQKDIDRAEGLQFMGNKFHGAYSPWGAEASKMAKLIKDNMKLVRRAKAVVKVWGTAPYNPPSSDKPEDQWSPFREALKRAGFSREQITSIENYK